MELLICIYQLTSRTAALLLPAVLLHTTPKKYTQNRGFPLCYEIKSGCTSLLSAKEHFPEATSPREPLVPKAAPGDAAGEGHPAVSKDTTAPS